MNVRQVSIAQYCRKPYPRYTMAQIDMTSDDLKRSFQGDATFNSLLQANGAC